jgi:TPR repeat protein
MAQYNLGNFFLLGKGTQKNYLEAVRWFKLASNNGVAEAAQNFLILSKVSKVADLNKLERSKLHVTTFPVQLIGLSTPTELQKYDKRSSIIKRIVLKAKEEIVRAPLSVNEMISEIQVKLSKDGFYIGSIDGLFGPNIESAIRVYQLEQGLPVSGSPSKELLQYMQRD